MLYLRKSLLAVLALSILGVGVVSADEVIGSANGALSGHVQSLTAPLPQSMVYAYHLGDTSLRKVVSDTQGNFRFDSLPAGLYKVIAFRDGFVPSIALLTRASARAQQFLDMELQKDSATAPSDQDSFWTVRDRIPSDVLRDIESAAAEATADVNN
ncbi:MAG: carboxypeptidase-like regulatory domain-containing protein, partial [Thermoanaerobaculia bacterium]